MIAFPSENKSTPVSRVRGHLRTVPGKPDSAARDGQLVKDLRQLMARLGRLRHRGTAFQGVELSPYLSDALPAMKMVGSELIVLHPERRGA